METVIYASAAQYSVFIRYYLKALRRIEIAAIRVIHHEIQSVLISPDCLIFLPVSKACDQIIEFVCYASDHCLIRVQEVIRIRKHAEIFKRIEVRYPSVIPANMETGTLSFPIFQEIRLINKIKLPDSIIAATAIAQGLSLITADTGFLKIRGLQVEKLEP